MKKSKLHLDLMQANLNYLENCILNNFKEVGVTISLLELVCIMSLVINEKATSLDKENLILLLKELRGESI